MTGNRPTYDYPCPDCGTINSARGRALTMALTCRKCHVYYCTHYPAKDKFLNREAASLPQGSKGTLDGLPYEVMGFAVKRERKYRYQWHEYFLFHPASGIAFLTEYDGNWNFIKPMPGHPWRFSGLTDDDLQFQDETFSLYAKYKADLVFASGEFFSDIIEETESTVHYEHIRPPHILNFESSQRRLGAYLGTYIAPKDVANAFAIPLQQLPPKKGMGYTEPMSFPFSESGLLKVTAWSFLLAVIITFYNAGNASNKVVLRHHYSQDSLKGQKVIVTPSFVLDDGTKNLVFRVYAPVSNDWFFAEYSLINEVTDEEFVFTNEIEYYYGVESGEKWSEGSRNSEAYLSSIPSGKYHVNIYPEFGSGNSEFDLAVVRDVPYYSNFFITLLLLALFPGAYYWYRRHREVKRWSDSDYSPYQEE